MTKTMGRMIRGIGTDLVGKTEMLFVLRIARMSKIDCLRNRLHFAAVHSVANGPSRHLV